MTTPHIPEVQAPQTLQSSASRIAATTASLTYNCMSGDLKHQSILCCAYKLNLYCPEEFTSNMWSWIFLFYVHRAQCVCVYVCVLCLYTEVCPCPLHHRCSELGSGEQQGLSLGGGLNQWWQSHDLFLSNTHTHTNIHPLSGALLSYCATHTKVHIDTSMTRRSVGQHWLAKCHIWRCLNKWLIEWMIVNHWFCVIK